MKTVLGNILDCQGLLVQQVNARGKFNKGLAHETRQKFPIVYNHYYQAFLNRQLTLGKVVLVTIKPTLQFALVVGQLNYGNDPSIVYTDYTALRTGLERVATIAAATHLQIFIPHGLGCGLARGDWAVVSKIADETVPTATVVRLP